MWPPSTGAPPHSPAPVVGSVRYRTARRTAGVLVRSQAAKISSHMKSCIYCAGASGPSTETLEHIWPKALGGAVCGDIFKTRQVCRRCNNEAGLWVDGAFLRNLLIQQERMLCDAAYYAPGAPTLPGFVYLGEDVEFPIEAGEVCERWLGPSGETLGFVHGRDAERWFGYAGGNPIERKQHDPGRVYLGLVDRGTWRALVALEGALDQFRSTRFHCLTQVDGLPDRLAARLVSDRDRTPQEQREVDWIKDRAPRHHIRAPVTLNFDHRFLAKLALGIGANAVGRCFPASAYADELRNLLRRTGSDDDDSQVQGSGFWSETSSAMALMGAERAWTVVLQSMPEGLVMIVVLPSGRTLTVLVAPRAILAEAMHGHYHEGVAHIIVPVRRAYIGPVRLPDLVHSRLSGRGLPALQALEDWRRAAAEFDQARQ